MLRIHTHNDMVRWDDITTICSVGDQLDIKKIWPLDYVDWEMSIYFDIYLSIFPLFALQI